VSAVIDTDLRTLTRVWRGELPWLQAVRTGQLQVHGPTSLRRELPSWFKLSTFASAALTA
jgi:putative sterol carrier protein